jgi:hypothetical protein
VNLNELQPQAAVRGIVPDQLVTVVNVQWFGSEALELTYKTPAGKVANELLYRHDESRIELVEHGRPSSLRLLDSATSSVYCETADARVVQAGQSARGTVDRTSSP